MNAREAAYLALLSSLKQERFVSQVLDNWQKNEKPSPKDYAFAQEMALGACRMAKALDYMGAQLSSRRTLSVKVKERALLRLALYQYYFMDRVPVYAIASEMMKLAKKYCHSTFAKFMNAILSRLQDTEMVLPAGNTVEELCIRYSYPEYFIGLLMKEHSFDAVEDILKAGNSPSKTTVRLRTGWNAGGENSTELFDMIVGTNNTVGILKERNKLDEIAVSQAYYIQNTTPAVLIADLAKHILKPPEIILDLCASPGGKLLAAHDMFPEAALYGNDVSQEKIDRLQENFTKYGVEVLLSCGQGEEYASERMFDLIILDVPCSNSGVLNKRAEARWRLTEETMAALKETQKRLLEHACTLIASGGSIWYMTCSILRCENEAIVDEVCAKHKLKKVYSRTVLPNKDGWDGGYGAFLI